MYVKIQAYLGDIVDLVLDHHNEANLSIKRVTQIFWFPSAYKSYVYGAGRGRRDKLEVWD